MKLGHAKNEEDTESESEQDNNEDDEEIQSNQDRRAAYMKHIKC